MAHIFKCYIFLIILLISHRVDALDYVVGDDDKWTTSVNYKQWSEKYNFIVGDTLVFMYAQHQHNVYEVSQDSYKSCDASTGVLGSYFTGYDRVPLSEARDYWFLCSIQDHCKTGMKLNVQVQDSTDTNDTNAGFTPTSKTTNVIGQWEWVWSCYLVALVGLFMLGY